MKKYFIPLVLFFALLLFGCGGDDNNTKPVVPLTAKVTLKTPDNEPAFIYVNGVYSGKMAPTTLTVSTGSQRTIGLALKNSFIYLRKKVKLTKDTTLDYTAADRPVARKWKVLFVGINTVTANSLKATFTKAELDTCYSFFKWSVANHFIPYTYGTTTWDYSRQDITTPVTLTSSGYGYEIEGSTISNLISTMTPGNYDCVFVCWKQKDGSVDFGGNYFGLTETNPLYRTYKTGYVQVKFTQGSYSSIADAVNYYKNNDPGVWIHEWLHSVAETFYQDKGLSLPPSNLGGGLVVHAASSYGYTFPWMNWYLDLMSARVISTTGGFIGIGPDAFVDICTVRETANGCSN